MIDEPGPRTRAAALMLVALVYAHNTLPYLTMMPRVNIDEPWLMERAYQIVKTGVPAQPMYGLTRGYLLQVGFPYLLAGWMRAVGAGLLQARLLGVLLGFGVILMIASLGKRLIGAAAGVAAGLFLAVDSNFLGGARNARTDIPAVFFATAALAGYARGRERGHWLWFFVSGLSAGVAMLCHGNTFWVGIVLVLWFVIDRGPRGVLSRDAWTLAAGAAAVLGPYMTVIVLNRAEVQRQIAIFAADRVPGSSLSFVLHQMALEIDRYRNWYFGLVTNGVPNPLLWTFQAAAIAGLILLVARMLSARLPSELPGGGAKLVLALILTSVVILAAFVNNKVPVYLPHVLIGLSLAAGLAAADVTAIGARWLDARGVRHAGAIVFLVFVAGYGAASTAYYERWYASARKSELVPYEQTSETLRALVAGATRSTVYGSPHFWVPFYDDPNVAYLSYSLGPPHDAGGALRLLVDESQWLPDMNAPGNAALKAAWVSFITERCALDGMALGTAYGTIASYRCGATAPAAGPVRIIGGRATYTVGESLSRFDAAGLMTWPRYDNPRRRPSDQPLVSRQDAAVRVSGTGWPGIVLDYPTTPGAVYLVRVDAHGARDGDLLYLGTWMERQVLSLGGAASSGMPTPLDHQPWFPGERAFIATAPHVRVAIYSEAPHTDFTVASVEIAQLRPAEAR